MKHSSKSLRIALAGNPNSGKTTLFNALTGSRARVGNYSGVTVERREAALIARSPQVATAECTIVDLPGCYSLTARSPEEDVAHRVLIGEFQSPPPDKVVCVVDVTQAARGLYLALQLLELELPVIIALNMMDLAPKVGVRIDAQQLARHLGVPVIPVSARDERGMDTLIAAMLQPVEAPRPFAPFGGPLAIQAIQDLHHQLAQNDTHYPRSVGACLWLLCSHLETSQVMLSPAARQAALRAQQVIEQQPGGLSAFRRGIIEARYQILDDLLADVLETTHQHVHTWTERIDRVLLHPIGGMTVFVMTMLVLFQAVFAWSEPFIELIENGMRLTASAVDHFLAPGLVQSLLVNGLLAGIGNVLVFLPQIALLFLGLTLLEESGYLSRAAFLTDRMMRRVGLHGKAFIPLMSSFACAVPGIMAARTVESRRDRLVTIFIAPFMSCSARLPVYVLVISAVFAAAPPILGWISVGGIIITAMYFLGLVAAIGTAWLLKHSVLKSPVPPLLLDMPVYRLPKLKHVLARVRERCKIFVVQTGTTILALSVLLWGILSFPRLDHATPAQQLEHSLGGRIGHTIEPLIQPLGFDWHIGIGLVASFAAREVLVSTLGQVYALDNSSTDEESGIAADSPVLRDAILSDLDPATGRPRFTPLVGTSLMVFFVLALQCMSTFATVKRETNSWRWPVLQLIYMNAVAYLASLAVHQIGTALGIGT